MIVACVPSTTRSSRTCKFAGVAFCWLIGCQSSLHKDLRGERPDDTGAVAPNNPASPTSDATDTGLGTRPGTSHTPADEAEGGVPVDGGPTAPVADASIDAVVPNAQPDGGSDAQSKNASGDGGCDLQKTDTDGDTTPDSIDLCPMDPDKVKPGACGCGNAEPTEDSDCDGTIKCQDSPRRKRITIQGRQVFAPQNGFPVLVLLSDADLRSGAHPSGLDIHFQGLSGNELPFERVAYDSDTGVLEAWVKLDLTGADQDFYINYADGDLTEKSSPANVWDSEFEVVYHLQDLSDSTAHGRDGTDRGTSPYASGRIGAARDFDGDSEILGPEGVLPINDDYWTVSYWGRALPNNRDGDREQWAVSTQDNSQDGMTIGIETPPAKYANGNMLSYVSGWRSFRTTVMPDKVWARVDARVYMNSGGYVEFSLNGGSWERRSLGTTAIRHTTGSWITIGGEEANTDENWLGQLDEVRISSTLRSDDWLTTEYNNQKPASTFLTVGAEELP